MNRDKLIEVICNYFDIGNDCYTYNLTRVKEAFSVGTMSFDDFEELSEENAIDLADYIIEKIG